jgi:hypothetical protein
LAESGTDAWQLLEWLREPARCALATGQQSQLLARVFAEQFELQAGQAVPAPKEKIVVAASSTSAVSEALEAAAPTGVQPQTNQTQIQAVTSNANAAPKTQAPGVSTAAQVAPVAPQGTAAPRRDGSVTGQPEETQTQGQVTVSGATIQPKDKKQLASDRVQNPHELEATYSVKGQGENKKEHVGYKVQVAETVCEVELAPGEPTRNFITGMVTHPAYESDEAGALKMEQEQARMGLDKPPVQYVDGAYISAQILAQAQAEDREIIGPAQSSPQKVGRFTAEDFQIRVEELKAICPAGKVNTQCSRPAVPNLPFAAENHAAG